ncbi:hypothetical protein A2154_03760 [Candidatus Gottesmanbacteria bacterium RBG_16_43_7]|uniref:Glycosyl transferase family 1 domain-containing protein n=1 Tax=Candidatus Gottesmanbacteria bacterium RBG_16_43_7 TaxID=1798373 RepID=A0A1F5Z9Z5_9BACT|nr:MAG: hypothetical protein A2154_03760 [Candidatus Gottesmanbacteria bacterium RBG_16_43_7]
MKPKIAIIRGKFLNKYEMQFYEPLRNQFDITAFGSLSAYHRQFKFPAELLPSPMDLPDFPFRLPLLNRLFVDAHYLLGLERKLIGFDLVHSAETYYRYTQQALNAKRSGYVKKVIATVLENIPFNNEGIIGRRRYKARARQELDHLIALTQASRTALIQEGADPAKITVISHFIDSNRFSPTRLQQQQIADGNLRALNILYTGRLELYKGVMDIFKAAQQLLSDKQLSAYSLTFLFVGAGSQADNLNKSAARCGLKKHIQIENHPYEDMPQVYQRAHIFVAPSKPTRTWMEQYNTALLEAQASGLPIVTTDTGGIRENVGTAAIILTPGDIRSLAQSIKLLIQSSDRRRELAQIARVRAITIHDIKIGAGKIARLYHSLL